MLKTLTATIISAIIISYVQHCANLSLLREAQKLHIKRERIWWLVPFITILGIPTSIEQDKLEALTGLIQQSVATVPILDIPADEVFVLYQPDLQEAGLGEELGAKIEGLFQKPERTTEVLQNMQSVICDCLRQFAEAELPQCTCVEAFVNTMIPPEHCTIVAL